jgi:hypothetical protein
MHTLHISWSVVEHVLQMLPAVPRWDEPHLKQSIGPLSKLWQRIEIGERKEIGDEMGHNCSAAFICRYDVIRTGGDLGAVQSLNPCDNDTMGRSAPL